MHVLTVHLELYHATSCIEAHSQQACEAEPECEWWGFRHPMLPWCLKRGDYMPCDRLPDAKRCALNPVPNGTGTCNGRGSHLRSIACFTTRFGAATTRTTS